MERKYINTIAVAAGCCGFFVSSIAPSADCWSRKSLCEVQAADLPHGHEREPAPSRTLSLKPILTSTSTTILGSTVEDPGYGLRK